MRPRRQSSSPRRRSKARPTPQLQYGVMVFLGEGVAKNPKIGAEWLLIFRPARQPDCAEPDRPRSGDRPGPARRSDRSGEMASARNQGRARRYLARRFHALADHRGNAAGRRSRRRLRADAAVSVARASDMPESAYSFGSDALCPAGSSVKDGTGGCFSSYERHDQCRAQGGARRPARLWRTRQSPGVGQGSGRLCDRRRQALREGLARANSQRRGPAMVF